LFSLRLIFVSLQILCFALMRKKRKKHIFCIEAQKISLPFRFISPSSMIAMWRYWFRLSRYVYGGNRSFAPILRQRRWSLLYDVYWLILMMMNRCIWMGTTGLKFLNTV
jgi:hypothetical protein